MIDRHTNVLYKTKKKNGDFSDLKNNLPFFYFFPKIEYPFVLFDVHIYFIAKQQDRAYCMVLKQEGLVCTLFICIFFFKKNKLSRVGRIVKKGFVT